MPAAPQAGREGGTVLGWDRSPWLAAHTFFLRRMPTQQLAIYARSGRNVKKCIGGEQTRAQSARGRKQRDFPAQRLPAPRIVPILF